MTTQLAQVKTDVNSILARIDAIAAAERVTKGALSTLSRDLLAYLVIEDSNDIAIVNRLLAVLTPMNRKVGQLFFGNFLPFELENTGLFGKKLKGDKRLACIVESVTAFLADETADIWSWAATNVKMEKKDIDFKKKIADDVRKALDEEKGGLSQADVIEAVLEGGMTVDAILALLHNMAQKAA